MMILSMIVAMDKNHLIGASGKMPWHLPQELQYFKRITMGKPVIMGRKTFESIGKPLTGRTNIVVTNQLDWSADGVLISHNLIDAMALASENLDESSEAMIIGGANLYSQAMADVEKLYLTVIDHEFKGDTWMQNFDLENWSETSCELIDVSDINPYTYSNKTLIRKK